MPIATNIKEKSSFPDQCAPSLAISVNAIKAKMAMGISWGALRIIGNLVFETSLTNSIQHDQVINDIIQDLFSLKYLLVCFYDWI